MQAPEDGMLESATSERRTESRLSCQIVMSPALDGIVVRTPPTQA
jgi:2Fe-2S ferredoxin